MFSYTYGRCLSEDDFQPINEGHGVKCHIFELLAFAQASVGECVANPFATKVEDNVVQVHPMPYGWNIP